MSMLFIGIGTLIALIFVAAIVSGGGGGGGGGYDGGFWD